MPSKIRDYEESEGGEEEVGLEDMPTSIDPYKVLAISKGASDDEVKKAYRKAALSNHPDKAPEDKKEAATEKFKEIAFAYAVLSDPARRKRYDVTGRTDEAVAIDDDFNWSDYFRAMYEDAVTEASIEKFKKEYKESDEERDDVLKAYTKGKGNMSVVYQMVMLSHVLEDDERFRAIIDAAIEREEVEAFEKYTKETEKSKDARMKRARREAEEAEAEAEAEAKKAKKIADAKSSKKGASGGTDDLFALIQQRQKDRASKGTTFLDNLEAKYSQPNKKGKKRAMDEPPEEAFAANKKRGKDGK